MRHLIVLLILCPVLFFGQERVLINRNITITPAEYFGVRANTSSYGGMYMETNGSSTGRPFYGFAINGIPIGYIYHDGSSDEMRFNNNGDRLSLSNTGALKINNAYTLPIMNGAANQVLSSDGLGGTSWISFQGGGGHFEDFSGTIRQVSGYNQNFLFGKSSMPINGQTSIGNFFFFEKNKAAFRGGTLSGNEFWSPDNTGTGSFAYGYDPVASGNYSNSVGFGTVSQSLAETVMGSYNAIPPSPDGTTWMPTDPIFTIGNGPNFVQRSSALTVYKNGNHKIGNSSVSSNFNLEINSESGNSEPFGINIDGTTVMNLNNNGEAIISAKNNDAILSMKSKTDPGLNRSRVIVRQDNGEDVYIGDVDANGGDVFIRADGDNAMKLEVGGNIGIGTIGPENKLHVKGDVTVEAAGTASASIFAKTNDATTSKWMTFENTSKNIRIGALESTAENLILESNGNKIQVNKTGEIEVGDALAVKDDTTTVKGVLHIRQNTFFPTGDPNKFDIIAVTDKFDTRANIITSEIDVFDDSVLKIGDVDNKHDKMVFTATGNNNIVIDASGRVGINQILPAYQLEVVGSAGKSSGALWSVSSDRRLKKNINGLSAGLDIISSINPVTFNYNSLSGYDSEIKHVGVIAQDLQKVAPYMVFEKENGYLDVNASPLLYITVNAIKELNGALGVAQESNQNLKQEVEDLKEQQKKMQKQLEMLLAKTDQ